MPKCSCGRLRPLNLPTIGIQYGQQDEFGVWHDDWPALILWNCVCGSTRGIRWSDATDRERRDALNAELSRAARCEMAGWGGRLE